MACFGFWFQGVLDSGNKMTSLFSFVIFWIKFIFILALLVYDGSNHKPRSHISNICTNLNRRPMAIHGSDWPIPEPIIDKRDRMP